MASLSGYPRGVAAAPTVNDASADSYYSQVLTLTEFQGMYAAPVLLRPAVSASQKYVVTQAQLEMTYGSAQTTSGGTIVIQYGSAANGAGTQAAATLSAATVNGWTASTVANIGTATSVANASAAGAALYLSNQTGAFATGTGATFKVRLWYRIVSA